MKWALLLLSSLFVVGAIYFSHQDHGATSFEGNSRDPQIQGASSRARVSQVTDGVRHSIPLDEILEGGPGKDGIPAINSPTFVRVTEVDPASLESLGIGIETSAGGRFYPFSILVWHEVVNDTIETSEGPLPVLVTYCPLCRTGVVFERRVGEVAQEFGVSGKLWQSNLLMYNRGDEESLWSQVLGEAVVGPHTEEKLNIVTSDIMTWGAWHAQFPHSEVLVPPGTDRPYGTDPYGDYYENGETVFPVVEAGGATHPKAVVFGIDHRGVYKAYLEQDVPTGESADVVGGENIVVEKNADGQVRFYAENGDLIPAVSSFWFSWAAVHPDTLVWEK